LDYKWYKNVQTFYNKRSKKQLIEMAMPIYDKIWIIKRYQRVYVDISDLQPYYEKFLENIDFVVNAKRKI
jgi:c-di-GMP-binding flagellar brake protein YcgR